MSERTEQSAVAYVRVEGVTIHAVALSTDGLRLAVPPVQNLPPAADAAEVGKAILAALDAYQDNYPHPSDWKTFAAVLKKAGMPAWRTLQARSRSCSVDRRAEGLRIVPTRNGGSRGDDKGFHDLEDSAVMLPPSCDPAALGAALLSAFGRCR